MNAASLLLKPLVGVAQWWAPSIGTSSAGSARRMPPSTFSAVNYCALKLKSLVAAAPAPTVTVCVSPCGYFSCQATSV